MGKCTEVKVIEVRRCTEVYVIDVGTVDHREKV